MKKNNNNSAQDGGDIEQNSKPRPNETWDGGDLDDEQ